jgi:hypothetical protein
MGLKIYLILCQCIVQNLLDSMRIPSDRFDRGIVGSGNLPSYATGDDVPLSVEYPQIRDLYRSQESGNQLRN